MYYIYVIQSKKDKQFYTGFTGDLQNRLQEHNAGRVSSTKERGPFELIYYEACLNEQDALAREKYLKSGMGKRYLKNRLKQFLSLTGQNPNAAPSDFVWESLEIKAKFDLLFDF
jgi:putative endonuclease